ncbi:response regulator [Lysobacter maris]|uniref:histidine kinase n=1 Tax=Marilutibacter maris TaxID=1605891 RepID=A0A508B8X7_9GAMM|nr:response regulator [Lysobacter maris]
MGLIWIRVRAARVVAWVSVLLVFAVGAILPAHARGPWVIRHYRLSDGLPVSSAAGSHVDGKGFLWIATHDGLVRFDGQAFKVYNTSNSPAIRDNRIVDIYPDSGGRLHALTAGGDLLRLEVGGVRRIRLGADGRTGSPIRSIHERPLCVTTAQGMFCEDREGGFHARQIFDPGDEVTAAFPVGDDQAWLLVRGKGIVLQTGRQRRVLFDDADAYRPPGLPPMAVVGSDGSLIVALDRGLLRLARDGTSHWLLRGGRDPVHIVQLRSDRDDTLWVGTDRGLFRFDQRALHRVGDRAGHRGPMRSQSWRAADGALWESSGGALFRDGAQVLESDGRITDVSFDATGTAWVSTLRDGLYALSRPRVETLGVADGLSSDNVYSVTRDSAGTMWLGSLDGPVQAIAPDGDIERYGIESGLPGANPWVVAAAPDDSIHVGTYAPGLFRKPPGRRRFEAVPLPGPLAQARILAISFDRSGRLWLGTTRGAWCRSGASWRRVWPETGDAAVHSILHATDGNAWLGTDRGLWRQGRGAVAAELLAGITVRDLMQDRSGVVWASTEGYGLARIDPREAPEALHLGRAEGLPSDSPHAVLEDDGGNLWVNSNQGVFKLGRRDLLAWISGESATLTPLMLGFADGVTELEGNGGVQPTAAFDRDGRIWFPYQRGVIRVDPKRFSRTRAAPVPVIDGLRAAGTGFVSGPSPLPVGVRSLSIHYSAADLHDGRAVRFRYRLMPGDGHWVDVGGQRTVSLASMSPGRYRFELVAANGDGAWAATPAMLEFTVPARWFETTRFRLTVVLGLMALVLLVAWQRVRGARLQAKALGRQVEARTRELDIEKRQAEDALVKLSESHRIIEKKNLRLADQASRLERLNEFRVRSFADISHELRTPLMLASMPLKEVQARVSTLSEHTAERLRLSISQLDRLTLLVQQLLSLAQAEAGQLKLDIASFDACKWLEQVVDGFRVLDRKLELGYELRRNVDFLPIFADRDRLTTVLENLLDNASRHAPAGSVIDVELSAETRDETLRITVSDSGPGFSQAIAKQLFQRFFRGERAGRDGLGIGLATAKELIELHGGRIGASSRPQGGASFWITLPLGSAHVSLDELDSKPTQAAVRLPATGRKAMDSRKVLIVEDHPELANYLGHRLGEYCPVKVVSSAEEAIEQLQCNAFGAVVSDVVLPGISGIELCTRIKADQRLAAIPVLLISARAETRRSEEGVAAGASEYLVKPFGFEALIGAISRAWPDASLYFSSEEKIVSDAGDVPLLAPALEALADPDFSVGAWARRAHLSERQLRRRVIELTGQSPVAWLREQRLLRVRRLISDGSCRTLSEAGARVGLDNPGYLYRIYRARFDTTDD